MTYVLSQIQLFLCTEKLMERSIAAGVIDVLDAYLEAFADDGDSLRSIVLALDLLTETSMRFIVLNY